MSNNYGIPLCDGETIDMGSFVLTNKKSNIYEFSGLSTDVEKLPKVRAIGTGSTALCVDNGSIYMYEETTKTWYEM